MAQTHQSSQNFAQIRPEIDPNQIQQVPKSKVLTWFGSGSGLFHVGFDQSWDALDESELFFNENGWILNKKQAKIGPKMN